MSTDRLTVASTLEQLAALLEFRGDNPFRIRAFRNAAKAILGLPGSVADALADGSLARTRGIGPGTVAIVQELLDTGRSNALEELKRGIPAGLLEMTAIPGLGATRVKLLHERLQIETLPELELAARDGRLARLPGFGVKTAEKVLRGIEFARGTQAARLWPQAALEAEVLRSALAQLPGVTSAATAGEVRRRSEIVSELAFVVLSDQAPARIHAAMAELPGLATTPGADPSMLSYRSESRLGGTVVVARAAQAGAALIHATGSADHLRLLAEHAASKGYVLMAAALLRNGHPVAAPDEALVYGALGLELIPPELREGSDEIVLAAGANLPKLIERADLLGFLHCHSTYSDGRQSVAEMALACREAGYSYLGISDHSKSAAYAGGMSRDELERQWKEIDAVNANLTGIRVLKGIESDILADGELDYDAATLARFDFVIGSIHSRFALGQAEMTERVLRALDSPYLTILGHPTGRQLLSRAPYPLDLEQVLARAAANRVALEINGDPHRLDLDWRIVRRARELGVTISIGADAHSFGDIGYMDYGIAMARKGGLEKAMVLNTCPVDEFLRFAKARRP